MTSRMNALRARKRAAGLVKVEVWVRPEHAAEVRELAKALTAKDRGSYEQAQSRSAN